MNLLNVIISAIVINFAIFSEETMNSIYDITVKDINLNEVRLEDYKGKVLLIVNVASFCGYTKQYSGLQSLYEKYSEKGLEILAFPCNDFGKQEPGTNEEIKSFCDSKFGISFSLFDKIKVIGEDKDPLYEYLIYSDEEDKGDVKWNFEKFLISKDSKTIKRFRSAVEPESSELISAIEFELNK